MKSRRASYGKITVMLTVEGRYSNGVVELVEPVPEMNDVKVLVTFPGSAGIDLAAAGLTRPQAAELRSKFETFIDWDDPVMDAYDDYDNAKKRVG